MNNVVFEEEYCVIKGLMGSATREQLSNLDWYAYKNVVVVLPSTGPCNIKSVRHDHPAYSFVLHLDDLYTLEVNGSVVTTQQNTITALSPKVEHRERSGEMFIRYIVIFIGKDFFEKQLSLYGTEDKTKIFYGSNHRARRSVKSVIKDFIIEYENTLPGRKQLLEAAELKITHAIIRSILNLQESSDRTGQRTNIDNAIQYMHTHFGKKITIGKLAAVANLSESHFIKVFKDTTGKTPKEYLLLMRLDKAKKMLQNTNKKNTEIALDCGFNNSSHFANTFKKYFKTTPLKFRNLLK
jgi:AraC-like DNA-binding protein